MIRFGLRLTLNGGREAAARLVIIAGAVALGVGVLLTIVAGIDAVNTQNARYAWLETGREATDLTPATPAATDPAWWHLSADEFRGNEIGRVDVAGTGPDSPVPARHPPPPGPGQYYASPAMADLLRSTPPSELGDRYPGQLVGTIGSAGLPAPDSLIIVVGRGVDELAAMPGASQVTSISTTPPNGCNGQCYRVGIDSEGMDLVLAVVAGALLFPVLIFIGTATRLAAARRDQRFAALRLVGATPGQVSVISAVESTVAAGIGVAAGFGLFYALRPPFLHPLHRPALLRRRPHADAARHRGGRPRRADRRRHRGPAGVAPGHDLAAGCHPPGHASRPQPVAARAGRRRPGRAHVLRARREAVDDAGADPGVPVGDPDHDGRADRRRPVADDARVAGRGAARHPARDADRRPPPRRRSPRPASVPSAGWCSPSSSRASPSA